MATPVTQCASVRTQPASRTLTFRHQPAACCCLLRLTSSTTLSDSPNCWLGFPLLCSAVLCLYSMKSGENDRGPTAALHWFSLQDDNCSDAVNCLLDISKLSTQWQDIAVPVKRQIFAQYTKCLLDTELLVYWISPLAFELWQVIMTWVINTGHNKYPLHALCSLRRRHARDVCRWFTIVRKEVCT